MPLETRNSFFSVLLKYGSCPKPSKILFYNYRTYLQDCQHWSKGSMCIFAVTNPTPIFLRPSFTPYATSTMLAEQFVKHSTASHWTSFPPSSLSDQFSDPAPCCANVMNRMTKARNKSRTRKLQALLKECWCKMLKSQLRLFPAHFQSTQATTIGDLCTLPPDDGGVCVCGVYVYLYVKFLKLSRCVFHHVCLHTQNSELNFFLPVHAAVHPPFPMLNSKQFKKNPHFFFYCHKDVWAVQRYEVFNDKSKLAQDLSWSVTVNQKNSVKQVKICAAEQQWIHQLSQMKPSHLHQWPPSSFKTAGKSKNEAGDGENLHLKAFQLPIKLFYTVANLCLKKSTITSPHQWTTFRT